LHLLPLPEAGVGGSAGPAPASTRFVADLTRSVAVALALAALAALGVAFALARGVVGPLEALTRAVRNLDAGELDARVDVRSADEIGALATAFNDMAARLGRTERLRRALVADVAHELRTPLTNLMAQLEAMQDGLAQADGPALASLHEEVVHLARLIDDLEELAAADAGQVRLDLRSLVLGEELERAMTALVPRATRAGVLLTLVPAPGPPARVRADARRLGQVMRNLLDNALAHTPAGGRVTVTTRAEPGGAGGQLAVTVADTGVGIADEHLARIFDRFYRVDPSRARETGGSGLGLAIVRQYVELMGGTVEVTSRAGAGTSLTFTLPRATDS
jgi:signal transduction histidine kinase